MRARAIENQAFVVAANQVGRHAPGLRTGGRSMIVDPWGLVLAQAPDAESYASPTSTSTAWSASAPTCRRWPTAAPEVYG